MKRVCRRFVWVSLVSLWGAALLLAQATACAPRATHEDYPGLTELWTHFRDMPDERALAITRDPRNRWVGAAVGGHDSRAEAERRALEGCERRRLLRRLQAPCRLYAVGDEVVWKSW